MRYDQDRYQAAKTLLDDALLIAHQINFRFTTSLILCQLGHTVSALRQSEATHYYQEGYALPWRNRLIGLRWMR